MKLYELERGKWFIIIDEYPEPFKLHNIDGAYSYCTDMFNNVHHISASAEVIETEPQ